MTSLAYHWPEKMSSEQLAIGAKTNPGLIRRLLSKLSKAGLVSCQKGKCGGSALLKNPEQISLDLIYASVTNGPLIASFEKEPHRPCPVSCQIGDILTDVFANLEESMIKGMQEGKLSDLLNKLNS